VTGRREEENGGDNERKQKGKKKIQKRKKKAYSSWRISQTRWAYLNKQGSREQVTALQKQTT